MSARSSHMRFVAPYGERGRVGVTPSTHGYASASPYTDDDDAMATRGHPASSARSSNRWVAIRLSWT